MVIKFIASVGICVSAVFIWRLFATWNRVNKINRLKEYIAKIQSPGGCGYFEHNAAVEIVRRYGEESLAEAGYTGTMAKLSIEAERSFARHKQPSALISNAAQSV